MILVGLESHIPELIAESQAKARFAVERTCALVTGRAMAHSRVRFGIMRDGWEFDVLEFEAEGYVFNLVRYTIYNEYGTRYMSAHPMLRPAIAETIPEFEGFVAEIYAL